MVWDTGARNLTGPTTAPPNQPGAEVARVVIPGYQILEVLGYGSGTVVYRVRRDGDDYALKLIERPFQGDAPEISAFRREAAQLACVAGARLPSVHEVGEFAGHPYLVMDLIEGRRLSSLIASRTLGEDATLKIGMDVTDALAAAHRVGLVHRDLKPDNVIVDGDGRAWLVDFGLATMKRSGSEEVLAGTPLYGSPEQSGLLKRPVDGRSDLYSLGVVLFECATGAPPFVANDVGELLRAHASQAPPDPRSLAPELTPAFGAIIRKLLAKDPDARYQRAEGVLADLRRLHDNPSTSPFSVGDEDRPLDVSFERVPLIGRVDEFARLCVAWDDARAGRGALILVRGAVGTGKTRLVTELTAAIREAGRPTLSGRCSMSDEVPLGVIRAAVGDYLAWAERRPEPERSAILDAVAQAAAPFAGVVVRSLPVLESLLPEAAKAYAGAAAGHGTERQTTAIAEFIANLARLTNGLVLHIDDGHRVDQVTLEVLAYLGQEVPHIPLLVIFSARDDAAASEGLSRLRHATQSGFDSEISLDRLGAGEMASLLGAFLPGARLDPEPLVARSDGVPFTLLEYARLIVELGLIRPSWGVWLLDVEALDRLRLSPDVLDLVRRRLAPLGQGSRDVLRTAAVLRDRFTIELLAEVHGTAPDPIADVLQEASDRRLVESRGQGLHSFLHDAIIEVFEAELDEASLRRLHQRAAMALDRVDHRDGRTVYARANHFLRGEPERTPERAVAACVTAGAYALESNAPADTIFFLRHAMVVSEKTNTPIPASLHVLLAEALHQRGHFEDAKAALRLGLTAESDQITRARAYVQLANAHVGLFEFDEGVTAARAGLRELGTSCPTSPLVLVASSVPRFVAALAAGWGSRRGRLGEARAADTRGEREREFLAVHLHDLIAQVAMIRMRFAVGTAAAIRTLPLVRKLGPSIEYVRAHASIGYCLRVLGLRHGVNWLFRRARHAATDVADPRLVAEVSLLDTLSGFFCHGEDGQRLGLCLETHGRWLETNFRNESLKALYRYEAFRGNTAAAASWYRMGVGPIGGEAEAAWRSATIVQDAVQGRSAEVAAHLAALPVMPENVDWTLRLEEVAARLLVAVEQTDFGESYERGVAEFQKLPLRRRFPPRWYRSATIRQAVSRPDRPLLVLYAFGRLGEASTRPDLSDRERLALARPAVRLLGRFATSPFIRAYHSVAEASLRQLIGDHHGTLRTLDRAEARLRRAEAPLVDFEVAWLRARALGALGYTSASENSARFALMLATENGWSTRIRRVSAEFRVGEVTPYAGMTSHGGPAIARVLSGRASNYDDAPAARRLAALEQVSLAASRALDPEDLTRVALDETIKIMGADRALLFLMENDTLVPKLGRGVAGNDLRVFSGFSSTLVQRVRQSGGVLVVTGTDEGMALGAMSMVTHGLRSIMVAPIELDGRFLGAVYLDSRVANGVFTQDDAGLLVAIVNHIAVSLETARMVRLEAAVQAERERRDLAERLHSAMSRLSETLNPQAVLRRLIEQISLILPGELGWLLIREDDKFGIIARFPDQEDSREPTQLTTLNPVSLEASETDIPVALPAGRSPCDELVGYDRPSVTIPLRPRDGRRGLAIVAGPPRGAAYRDLQVDVAMVLARHGMTAYDHASLFERVNWLATTDEVTGLANRHDFFTRASRTIERTRELGLPLCGIMIDIDHFKWVNDAYGHQTGDEVLRAAADRIRGTLRATDLICRYGGEEFALVLRDVTDEGEIAERLRRAFADAPVPTSAGPVTVTISVGVTALKEQDTSVHDLLTRADRALYAAKAAGRDRVARIPV